jgi:hypothetical protein
MSNSRNLTTSESEFRDSITALINTAPKNLLVTAPNLFTNRVAVQSLITRYEMYKLILEIPGDIIECGVYQGNSFCWLAHLSIILEPYSINRRIIGFDTFNGFSSIDKNSDPSDISEKLFSDTSYETLKGSLDALDQIRPVNSIKRFEIVKGDIVKTLPEYINNNPWMTCAMLILDTDLYRPTKTALESILEIMPEGGVIVFDEYNYQNYPGETQAIREFFNMNKLCVRKLKYESCTAYAIIKN